MEENRLGVTPEQILSYFDALEGAVDHVPVLRLNAPSAAERQQQDLLYLAWTGVQRRTSTWMRQDIQTIAGKLSINWFYQRPLRKLRLDETARLSGVSVWWHINRWGWWRSRWRSIFRWRYDSLSKRPGFDRWWLGCPMSTAAISEASDFIYLCRLAIKLSRCALSLDKSINGSINEDL